VNPANPTGKLAADAVKFYTAFVLEDEIWDETLPASTVAFANSKVAMYFGPSWRASEINKMNPNLRYKTVPLPQLRKEDPGEPDVSYATYWVEGVWNRSANKEDAWDFLKFLSEPESLEMLFNNLSKSQIVGEPYPRVDMNNLLKESKILSSITALAPQAKSWFLADATNDGPTGINSQINSLFKEVIDNVNSKRDAERELAGIAPKIIEVLSQYGIRVK
jgi:ABC-type glycerol-3-phosphate transport system substrate-binding protein